MKEIKWQDFEQVELRVGTVIEVEDFPQARRPAFILKVDFGKELGVKKCSAQITERYTKLNLMGKQIVAVVNFPSKQVGPIMSECLVTGFYGDNGAVTLAVPEGEVPNGAKLA